jgi:hypothetical protein
MARLNWKTEGVAVNVPWPEPIEVAPPCVQQEILGLRFRTPTRPGRPRSKVPSMPAERVMPGREEFGLPLGAAPVRGQLRFTRLRWRLRSRITSRDRAPLSR